MKKGLAIFFIILTFFLIYFLQSNFFTWFTISGIMPNLYIILVLFIGIFIRRKFGVLFGLIFGLYLDIVLGTSVGISGITFALIGFLSEIFSRSFSKDSRITVILMVIGATILYESIIYAFNIIRCGISPEILSFAKILLIEAFFNSIITIIIYPIMKRAGYAIEDTFEDKMSLTRYF